MRPLANFFATLVVISGAGCGSSHDDATPPDLFPPQPPAAVDMAMDAAPPPPDLLPPPPDLAPPPRVDAPIQPPNFVGITSPGALVLGAGFVQATRTLQPACVGGPKSFEPQSEGATGTPRTNLDALGVERMLAIGSGTELEYVSLYDAAPSIPAFVEEAAGDWTTDLNYLIPLAKTNVGFVVFKDEAISKIGDCPDHFVYQLKVGARLVVGLKLHFVDRASLASFEKQYGTQLNEILQRDDLGWVSVALDHKATISVQAAQVGGDPLKLEAIVGASQCSIGNLPACNETITQAIVYSRQFSQDLGPIPQQGSTELGGWVTYTGVLRRRSNLPWP